MRKACRMVENKLLDYIEGNLPANMIKSIEEHRKSCVKCDHIVERVSAVLFEVPKIERFQISDSFWPGLQEKIRKSERVLPVSDRIFSGFKMMLRPAALILILLAGIFFGYQMGNVTDGFGEISINKITDADLHSQVFVEKYLQDFQEVLKGSPAEFYLQAEFDK
ncbi:MAG TPA: hypothetical protein ENN58_00970 [bacterium]|nr:hypothetical protein [bacterium]